MIFDKKPYLKKNRLADVIAAITAMSNYRFYKLDYSGWAERINNSENDASYWKAIFEDHPEFFRINSKDEKASLVWRRQLPKTYHPQKGEMISGEEFYSLSKEERGKYTRRPLNSEELATLLNSAIELHGRAIDQSKFERYLVPIVFSFLGALLGAYIAS